MLNLAPWFYRKLLNPNKVIQQPQFYKTELLTGEEIFESNVFLNENLRPKWITHSKLYNNCDGSGAHKFKNVAVYKAISEALERYAFYYSIDLFEEKFCFDVQPTTTGMAAFPYFNSRPARENAKAESIERWAIHNFNFYKLPVLKIHSNNPLYKKFEIITPFDDYKVALLAYEVDGSYCYGFAAGSNYILSEKKALYELDRNRRILNKINKNISDLQVESYVDRTLLYYATAKGHKNFLEKIENAPRNLSAKKPKILCDLEMVGPWTEYTKVWRYLLEDSYFDCSKDHTFFMF